jgi:hypothetical protein
MGTTYSAAIRNLMLDAIDASANSGYLRFYSGTQPATPETALSGNTLLAQCTIAADSMAAASAGSKAFNAITADTSADATGTCTFARLFASDGTTALADFSVGTSGEAINFPTVSFVAGAQIGVSSLTIAIPATEIG